MEQKNCAHCGRRDFVAHLNEHTPDFFAPAVFYCDDCNGSFVSSCKCGCEGARDEDDYKIDLADYDVSPPTPLLLEKNVLREEDLVDGLEREDTAGQRWVYDKSGGEWVEDDSTFAQLHKSARDILRVVVAGKMEKTEAQRRLRHICCLTGQSIDLEEDSYYDELEHNPTGLVFVALY